MGENNRQKVCENSCKYFFFIIAMFLYTWLSAISAKCFWNYFISVSHWFYSFQQKYNKIFHTSLLLATSTVFFLSAVVGWGLDIQSSLSETDEGDQA
jgi:hypothetical protein